MNKRILIIDDDQHMLCALEFLFTEEGYLVEAINAAAMVIPTVLKFQPEIILMDIRLGDGDGRLICDELKNSPITKHLPVILLTALSYREISEFDCLADAIIGKPYDIKYLLNTVSQLSDRTTDLLKY
ncbi:MAG: response regulator [Pedobacter sp.]|nr:MAG: response regulator [Pedobacter sp.]